MSRAIVLRLLADTKVYSSDDVGRENSRPRHLQGCKFVLWSDLESEPLYSIYCMPQPPIRED